jgi:hypothetical protein
MATALATSVGIPKEPTHSKKVRENTLTKV